MNTKEEYFRMGVEMAGQATSAQIDYIMRTIKEYQRLGFNEDSAREFGVRVGMKILLDVNPVVE